MDKASVIKKDIFKLIENYLGTPTAKTFYGYYEDETLPIFCENALAVLGEIIGTDKARNEMREIFARNHAAHNYV